VASGEPNALLDKGLEVWRGLFGVIGFGLSCVECRCTAHIEIIRLLYASLPDSWLGVDTPLKLSATHLPVRTKIGSVKTDPRFGKLEIFRSSQLESRN